MAATGGQADRGSCSVVRNLFRRDCGCRSARWRERGDAGNRGGAGFGTCVVAGAGSGTARGGASSGPADYSRSSVWAGMRGWSGRGLLWSHLEMVPIVAGVGRVGGGRLEKAEPVSGSRRFGSRAFGMDCGYGRDCIASARRRVLGGAEGIAPVWRGGTIPTCHRRRLWNAVPLRHRRRPNLLPRSGIWRSMPTGGSSCSCW